MWRTKCQQDFLKYVVLIQQSCSQLLLLEFAFLTPLYFKTCQTTASSILLWLFGELHCNCVHSFFNHDTYVLYSLLPVQIMQFPLFAGRLSVGISISEGLSGRLCGG